MTDDGLAAPAAACPSEPIGDDLRADNHPAPDGFRPRLLTHAPPPISLRLAPSLHVGNAPVLGDDYFLIGAVLRFPERSASRRAQKRTRRADSNPAAPTVHRVCFRRVIVLCAALEAAGYEAVSPEGAERLRIDRPHALPLKRRLAARLSAIAAASFCPGHEPFSSP